MCRNKMILYQCGCYHQSEFVQCDAAKATGLNVRCSIVTDDRANAKPSGNYCKKHLVRMDAPKKYRE